MSYRVAEFFAGMGLVRLGLERSGFSVVFANDIDETKEAIYTANFGAEDFHLGDIRDVRGHDVPEVDLATASFPCTDLSVAGNRAGLGGDESGMFWEFARVLREMGADRPPVVLLENVLGFATSHGGNDLRTAVRELNDLGYWCDVFVVDAAWFVPQSRKRLFVVGSTERAGSDPSWEVSDLRPAAVVKALLGAEDLRLHQLNAPAIGGTVKGLSSVVERIALSDERWWDRDRLAAFLDSLSPINEERLSGLRDAAAIEWRTAFRRTRNGKAVWEIRGDDLAGALRTARGGSSKQALVQAGNGTVNVRWMTPLEYARLMGAGDVRLDSVTKVQALYALGDAVCVPAIEWIARHHLRALLDRRTTAEGEATASG